MEWNKIEIARARQLISGHFDFALSQFNSQCTKSSESDNLEPELSYLAKECRTKDALHFAGACMYSYISISTTADVRPNLTFLYIALTCTGTGQLLANTTVFIYVDR